MIKIAILLILAAGIYSLTFWAKENLKKKKLLCFSIGLITAAVCLSIAVIALKNNQQKIGTQLTPVEDSEIIKMKELLSID
jgi:hypothetical protein